VLQMLCIIYLFSRWQHYCPISPRQMRGRRTCLLVNADPRNYLDPWSENYFWTRTDADPVPWSVYYFL